MEVDSDNELLTHVAAGGSIDSSAWPELLEDILGRLTAIAHDEFPIPKLPVPVPPAAIPPITIEPNAPDRDEDNHRMISPSPSLPPSSSPPDPMSQDENKENAPAAAVVRAQSPPKFQILQPGELPKQIKDMLDYIVSHLKKFESSPPHTIQRLAELILRPRAHYKALAPYLHAVDRVVMVTSGIDVYPLPPAIPDMSSINNAEDLDFKREDPAAQVSWSNPTTSTLGSDEALGGALLTPIPWLRVQSSRDSRSEAKKGATSGARIHSESTETIDGPNGMGRIETVSVSVNGIHSTGHARGVTQGELLRQEQRAGVVPITQLSRASAPPRPRRKSGSLPSQNKQDNNDNNDDNDEDNFNDDGEEEEDDDKEEKDGGSSHVENTSAEEVVEEDEVPHARGPEEIGIDDTGKQKEGTTFTGGSVDAHSMDVEAAVGRKHASSPGIDKNDKDDDDDDVASSSGVKREAEPGLEGGPAKKQVIEDEVVMGEGGGEEEEVSGDGDENGREMETGGG